MQIESVETNAGVAICDALSRTTSSMSLVWFCLPVAIDVLDFNRGVVHQDADRQSEPAERHDVDRLPDRTEHNDGGQDRQRD